MQKLIILFNLLLFSLLCHAQKPTQTIRGVVIDAKTRETLPGANIMLIDKNTGASSDINGQFKITDVEVGRYTMQVSYIGYETIIIPELLITSGREKILEIEMKSSYAQIEEVMIKSGIRKDRPINSMATVSARTFSVEEANRYAGAIDDPGRMAGSFAGVTTVAPHMNAIVVRGNAPKGLSWRLEGVDIPVPSHFSGSNVVGGGGLTVFSSQMLANSDFYTGAFPAIYGNAIAGVFDMRLRKGNSFRHEYALKVGVQGIEAGAEGPLGNKNKGSYLFNYRYSTMALIFPLLPEVNSTDELPVYQDISFKTDIPAGRAGSFEIWGIGGLSKSKMDGTDVTDDWIYPENREKMRFHYNMGATGISHSKTLSSKSFIRTTLAWSGSEYIYNERSRLSEDNPGVLIPIHENLMKSYKPSIVSNITHVYSSKLTITAGIDAENEFFKLSGYGRNYENNEFTEIMKGSGNSWLIETYFQGKYNLTENFFLTAGINGSWFNINDEYTFEPRFSACWQFHQDHQVSVGYGRHSQPEPLFVYFVKDNGNHAEKSYSNKNLKRTKADHFVFSYDWSVTRNMRLKIEPYYQRLYDVPVVDGTPYSMVNFMTDWTFDKTLVNKGTGTNRGIDITLERFLTEGFYFLTTASLYKSEYTGGDGIKYRTRYDGGYVINLLGGREWEIRRKNLLGLNLKFTFMGPYRHQPVDETETITAGTIIYDDNQPFSYRNSVLESMTDLTLSYRMNGTKNSSIIALQVKNIIGKQYMGKKYNIAEQKIENDFFTSPVPFLSYKIEF